MNTINTKQLQLITEGFNEEYLVEVGSKILRGGIQKQAIIVLSVVIVISFLIFILGSKLKWNRKTSVISSLLFIVVSCTLIGLIYYKVGYINIPKQSKQLLEQSDANFVSNINDRYQKDVENAFELTATLLDVSVYELYTAVTMNENIDISTKITKEQLFKKVESKINNRSYKIN